MGQGPGPPPSCFAAPNPVKPAAAWLPCTYMLTAVWTRSPCGQHLHALIKIQLRSHFKAHLQARLKLPLESPRKHYNSQTDRTGRYSWYFIPHLTDPITVGELIGAAAPAGSLPSPVRCLWEEINELLRLLRWQLAWDSRKCACEARS